MLTQPMPDPTDIIFPQSGFTTSLSLSSLEELSLFLQAINSLEQELYKTVI